jgi:hypothetical protein
MRGIWAALLVAVFGFALINLDAFAGRAEQKFPPCCRSNGKHHCALAQNQGGSSGPAFQVSRCPLYSGDQTMPSRPTAAIVKLSPAAFGAIFSHPTFRPETEALGRFAFDCSGQKRGPPFLP